ncbi:MAG: DUF1559 domain-containing protein [Planctomycetia bacterium]|nr:DUF1559 domain-containing protein [Planctomycetia bacterium]
MQPSDATKFLAVRRALSLAEVLVVLAILGLLVGLTLPAVQKVRSTMARASCQNHLRQLALTLHQYHDKHTALPPGWTLDSVKPNYAYLGWHARILPLVEQESLWLEVVRAYESHPNPRISNHPPQFEIQKRGFPLFVCPADPRGTVGTPEPYRQQVGLTSYLGNLGTDSLQKNGVLFINSATKFTDIRDGMSNTLLIGERPPSSDLMYGWWYRGIGQNMDGSVEVVMGVRELNHSPLGLGGCPYGPYSFQQGDFKNSCSRFHFWSPHVGGANFAFADGSVRFLAYSADDSMPALATRAGGESVTLPD